jgi:DNA replication protein DnaC
VSESCPKCHGRGWVVAADGGAGTARRCSCQEAEAGPRLLEAAGVPERYRHCRLEHFKTDGKPASLTRARELCRRYIEEFADLDGRTTQTGLVLIGPPGTGKTHLAAATLMELIRRFQIRGRFVDCTAMIHEIQFSFDADTAFSKSRVLAPVLDAELLVLDELGAFKPSAWVNDLLYLILNTRYTRQLPTIITTNYRVASAGAQEKPEHQLGPDRLAARISPPLVSRLYEMARIVELDAADFRREVKVHQHL